MRVCVVGLGYIGFPTACLLAKAGHEVIGVDRNVAILEDLREGRLHIVNEPDLQEIARAVLESGALKVAEAPSPSDAFILCVPTPFERVSDPTVPASGAEEAAVAAESGIGRVQGGTRRAYPRADFTFVVEALQSIGPHVRPGNLVVLESTVPPGTTERVVVPALEAYGLGPEQVYVAHAPERVLPGAIVREMVKNDRIIGGVTPEAAKVAYDLYSSFVEGDIVTTDAITAEFIKLVENAYRDVNIAFANELARISSHIGVDVWEVITLANRHPRVRILQPGPGVGGHCIAVDPYFIIQEAENLTPLLQAARQVNESMPREVVRLIRNIAPVHGRVALLGAAYKGNVADERESPSLKVAQLLEQEGYEISIHDPYVKRYAVALQDVVRSADLLVILTDHSDYRGLDPGSVAGLVRRKTVFDTRGVIDPRSWELAGFVVYQLGNGRTRQRVS